MVEQAKGEGSRLVVGGAPTLVETGGCYYPPTVFDQVGVFESSKSVM